MKTKPSLQGEGFVLLAPVNTGIKNIYMMEVSYARPSICTMAIILVNTIPIKNKTGMFSNVVMINCCLCIV